VARPPWRKPAATQTGIDTLQRCINCEGQQDEQRSQYDLSEAKVMNLPEIDVKYVFLDVVAFTREDRVLEDQVYIIEQLNRAVKSTIRKLNIPAKKRIFLPTGDGMCVALLNLSTPYDVHLRFAVELLKEVNRPAKRQKSRARKFQVRIGINDNVDTRVTDINGAKNILGKGINDTQRVMSIADGNQILVSSRVFGTLMQHDRYKHAFRHHAATVKHDVPTDVYQFIDKTDFAGLSVECPRSFRPSPIRKAANRCGLQNIYDCRDDEVKTDVSDAIRKARERVWLLGVVLSEKVSLNKTLLTRLASKKRGDKARKAVTEPVDVKILLLNPLRSPAIFRSFLESSADEFDNILSFHKQKNTRGIGDPYFGHRLYKDFHKSYDLLAKHSDFKAIVRFYAHSPNCWLIIADDKAYFQPYTFGRGTEIEGDNFTIGPQMPVFKFEGKRFKPFRILEDHFRKLWLTSDVDLHHLGSRVAIKEELVHQVFFKRLKWFEYIYSALHESNGEDRRIYPRQDCQSKPDEVIVKWRNNQKAKATIIDSSRDGVRLQIVGKNVPKERTRVELNIKPGKNDRASTYMARNLIESNISRFDVVHCVKPDRQQAPSSKQYIALKKAR
jgi:class 3 adenylate cyclase